MAQHSQKMLPGFLSSFCLLSVFRATFPWSLELSSFKPSSDLPAEGTAERFSGCYHGPEAECEVFWTGDT